LKIFQKLLILRCLNSRNFLWAWRDWICSVLHLSNLQQTPYQLSELYEKSSWSTPFIFLLTSESDPQPALLHFAIEKTRQLRITSMGRGQERRAEVVIKDAMRRGSWVCLQNCHLCPHWLPEVSRILDQASAETVNEDFRLWLFCNTSGFLPTTLAEASIKVAIEPTQGIKVLMRRLWSTTPLRDESFLSGFVSRGAEWKTWLCQLVSVHVILLGRCGFGHIGWNTCYNFTDSDLQISARQLQGYLREHPDESPYKLFRDLILECNYGARISETQDRRVLEAMLREHLSSSNSSSLAVAQYETHSRFSFGVDDLSFEQIWQNVESLPDSLSCIAYGLHPNAEFLRESVRMKTFLTDLRYMCREVSTSSDFEREKVIVDISRQSLEQISEVRLFDLGLSPHSQVTQDHMALMLVIEKSRYSSLRQLVVCSLQEVVSVCLGQIAADTDLNAIMDSLICHRTPSLWLSYSYLSMKPLSSYVIDLVDRLSFIRTWSESGIPIVFWLPGFFCMQCFLIGTLRQFAQRNMCTLDMLEHDFRILNEEPTKAPEIGAYGSGLYLEACRWDSENCELCDPEDTVAVTSSPTVWFHPCSGPRTLQAPCYELPVYTVPSRRDSMERKPYRRNFILNISYPSRTACDHWIRRGSVALTQLET